MNVKRIMAGALSLVMCLGAVVFAGSFTADASDAILKTDSKLMINDDGYLYRIRPGSTVADVAAEFEGTAVIKDGDVTLSDSDSVKSGHTVTVGDTSLICAVTGDVNGDGKINLSDVATAMRYFARWNPSLYIPAIDANLDGRDNLSDASLLMKYIAAWDVFVGTFDVEYSEDRLTASDEDKSLLLSVTDNMQKIDCRDTGIGSSATYLMKLAKNEIESCQIHLASQAGHEGLTVSFTDFANGVGGVIETEMTMHHYVSSESVEDPNVKVQYPDAMLPLAKFDVKSKYSQGFLLKIKASADAEPGLYMSRVTVRDSFGKAIKVCNVYAEIWDMVLPEETSCVTAFGLNWYNIYATHNLPEGDDSVLYSIYYDYLLENRISAYHLPYDFFDPRFEDYMNNPRVTSFCVDGCQANFPRLTDDELRTIYEKYGDDENWQKKSYFYMVDEPYNLDQCYEIINAAAKLYELCPGARQVSPCYSNPWYGDEDQTAVLEEAINLWCPLTSFFAENMAYNNRSVKKYGTAEERFNNYVTERGDDFWWYVCVSPRHPFANFFVNYQGEASRALFWQQYDYGATGCLYWSVNYWDNNYWRSADNRFYSGDGLLLYPGIRYGVHGPIGSIRIEYIRDGIEDYEYLMMATELCGAEAVETVLRKVTTDITHYTDDAKVIEAAKAELAAMIMANS